MAASFTISAIIKAVDKITAPVAAMTSKITAMTVPLRRVGAGIRSFSDATGITRLGGAFVNLGKAVAATAAQVAILGAKMLALAGVGISAGIVAITRGFADAGDEAATTASKLRVTTQDLQRLRYAADMLDVSNETLDGGLKKLSMSITKASKGAKDQVKALQLLGYTDREIRAGKISVADATTRLARRMEDEKKAKSNALVANALYGKSYLEMMPMLRAGGDAIADLAKEAEELGLVMSEDAIQAAGEFDDATKKLTYSLTGFRNAIGSQVIPIIIPLINELKNWIVANREIIASNVTEFVQNLAAALRQVDWEAVISGIKGVAEGFAFLAKNTEIITGLLSFLALVALQNLIMSAGSVVLAIKGIGVALLTTPVGWFLLAVAAIAGAVYLVMDNWGNIVGFFQGLWDGIKAGVSALGDFIFGVFDAAFNKIKQVIDAITGAASAVKDFATNNMVTRGFDRLFGDGDQPQGTSGTAPTRGLMGRSAQAAPRDAKAQVEVTFPQLPPGARVKSDVKGTGLDLGVNVGMQAGGAF